MSQQYDVPGLFDFLLHTPESGLRKMFVDGKPMTDAHFNLMLKIVRNCPVGEFAAHFEKQDFPKIKMGPAELKIKEKFWADCMVTWGARGLLTPALPTKVAA